MKRSIQKHPSIQTGPERFGPEEIVALRGELSRAEFAEAVGVTPLTVYRWELPEGANEARRPRGQVLERLRRFAARQGRAPSLAVDAVSPEEQALVLPVVEHFFQGDWRRFEAELLSLLTSGRIQSRGARGLVSAHLALFQLFSRNDGRAAFVTLVPALGEVQSGALPPSTAAAVHLAAAWVFSSPVGELFDPGKVAAHAAQAEALLPDSEQGDSRFLAWAASLSAAFVVGDQEQILRLLARADERVAGITSPFVRLLAERARAMQALFEGAPALAAQRLEALVAKSGPWPALKVSALALLSLRALDGLGDPTAVLEKARQIREAVRDGRLMPDAFFQHAARAEGEACLRLGRFHDAEAAFQAGEAAAEELRFPPLALWAGRARLLVLTGDAEGLRRLAERLRSVESPFLRSQARAYAMHQEARAALVSGDAARALELYGQAQQEARQNGWAFLIRDLLTEVTAAHLLAGTPDEALAAARRAMRVIDRFPSPMLTATLRLYEGVVLSRQGRTSEALPLVEAAEATFALAGERPTRLLASWFRARLSGEDAGPLAEEPRSLGMLIPPVMRLDGMRSEPVLPVSGRTEPLLVPVKRLTVRGVSATLICRELLTVVGELLPRHRLRLEELDSAGQATPLLGESFTGGESAEFSDGCGRRYRLGVEGTLTGEERAMVSAITSVAGLSLEVASLRGLAARPPVEAAPMDGVTELPGFIAASPSMRKLLAEIGRLSASRATVLITGESGSGKEVVARAVHDLSTRARQPYIAFNCAAVPRDLFEGQLFGYRKGAFTGATADHPGVIRAAHGGTLFLDEMGELPLDVQAKLLRFLENGEIFPLGEQKPVRVDVRVLAATHRELASLVRERKFREDLFYRLQVVPLRVPPLRERREDVLVLARHFLQRATPEGQEAPVLSADASAALLAQSWPGNVRELRNVMDRTMAFAPLPKVLTARHLRLG